MRNLHDKVGGSLHEGHRVYEDMPNEHKGIPQSDNQVKTHEVFDVTNCTTEEKEISCKEHLMSF